MLTWILDQLEIWKALTVVTERQIAQVETGLKAATPGVALFVGEGELIARELIDPHRFKNAARHAKGRATAATGTPAWHMKARTLDLSHPSDITPL